MPAITYSIKKNRLEKSYMRGMEMDPQTGDVYLEKDVSFHRLFLTKFDAAEDDALWGRFSMDMQITDTQVLYIYAAAKNNDTIYDENGTYLIEDLLQNPDYPDEGKKAIIHQAGGERYVGKNDLLLYALKGRYLFICIEILGTGEGVLRRMRIDRQGDQFMDTFPAVYRERNSFFHRFLSVFSSIYNDLDHEIERLPELLDADTCPAVCLPVYASWLGIDLSGDFLSEDAMRTFVKEAYSLNRIKGTRRCLERVMEIVLGEKVTIIEHNKMRAYLERGEVSESELIGAGILDVSILTRHTLSEKDRHQLLYLIDQFKPIRSHIRLIQLKDSPILDTDIYLDVNAVISGSSTGVMDENMEMDDEIVMDE